jgi:hypothetical protein
MINTEMSKKEYARHLVDRFGSTASASQCIEEMLKVCPEGQDRIDLKKTRKMINEDSLGNNVYLGYIRDRGERPYSWVQDGGFRKYSSKKEAKRFIDSLGKKPKCVKYFTEEEYKEIKKRQTGN